MIHFKSMEKINPLIENFDTPPFNKIELCDYFPAIEHSIDIARTNINNIIECGEIPTFGNCIEPLEFASLKLDSITPIFFNLNHSNTSDEMQELALSISTVLTTFSNDVSLNEKLFEKVKKVYENRHDAVLNNEQEVLLEKTYKNFIREGASLNAEDKELYRELTEELSQLSLTFSQNLLSATNAYFLQITDVAQLSGLPKYAMEIGKSEAESRNLDGWVYTLSAQSFVPFLQFCDSRELRKLMWTKYNTRCFDNSKFDNQQIVIKIANLRKKLANILGYNNFAHYMLEERMSKTQQAVELFLEDLIVKTKSFASNEWDEIKSFAKEIGLEYDLMPWDFGYYGEKLKIKKYDISDDKLKPYFSLDNIYNGLFDVIKKLYGITFRENNDIDKYHSDMIAYDVFEDSNRIAILYMDFFPRESKNSGAWMTSYRDKMIYNGKETTPIISIVCNFTKPTSTSPSLLTFNEVTTLFHEMGHALHGIFAKGKYPSLNGTNVAWDFVELPSQIMENWASDSYFLNTWAKHYKTNEPIAQELIDKLKRSENFLSGYAQMRQLSFAKCDMAWHTITQDINVTVKKFETEAINDTRISPYIENAAVSTAFSHVFSGGYAAGYYSYKWAEVLEADAFSRFIKLGLYNQECSNSFRDNILSQGSHRSAMDLYKKFMGREPKSDALFIKLGLLK